MAVIVVTRLRLKDHGCLDDFFAAAVAVLEQANKSAGILGADALAEANDDGGRARRGTTVTR